MTILVVLTLAIGWTLIAAAPYPEQEPAPMQEIEIEEPLKPVVVILPPTATEEPIKKEIIECEYPQALQVWNAMKAKGWTDEVCAGIMGNMMAECGGDGVSKLALNPYAIGDGETSYGLCQWHAGRKDELLNNYGSDIEAQINFLEYELDKYFPAMLVKWQSLDSYELIAYEFCVYFERPSNAENKGLERQELAKIAFEYFVGK